jgi:hypothetical protein
LGVLLALAGSPLFSAPCRGAPDVIQPQPSGPADDIAGIQAISHDFTAERH